MQKTTPMMEQYNRAKENAKDALLFFRLGDFYEMFYDDAIKAASYLGITLTKRGKAKDGQDIPMCGVPFVHVNHYIKKLIDGGFKIAICDQLEAADPSKPDIVKRDITRIITKGTIVEEEFLTVDNNYILSINEAKKNLYIMVYADISTGEILVDEAVRQNDIISKIIVINPSEILLTQQFITTHEKFIHRFENKISPIVNYNKDQIQTLFPDFYDLKIFDIIPNKTEPESIAFCNLIAYVAKMHKSCLPNFSPPLYLKKNNFMEIDGSSLENLEIAKGQSKSLFSVLNFTNTSIGSRLLKQRLLKPLIKKEEIMDRLDHVDFWVRNDFLPIHDMFKGITDILRIINKISMQKSGPKDLKEIFDSMVLKSKIAKTIDAICKEKPKELTHSISKLDQDLSNIFDLRYLSDCPPQNVKDGGVFKAGFSKDLDDLIAFKENYTKNISELLEIYKNDLGIKNIKIKTNNILGFFIEIPALKSENIPENFLLKQSLINMKRFKEKRLLDLEEKILSCSQKIYMIEKELFYELEKKVIEEKEKILQIANGLAIIDVTMALAKAANESNYKKPVILDMGYDLKISNFRHPVVESTMDNFIKNDIHIGKDQNTMIITGPNMAGKSTILRQSAILIIMAQMGSFVPADHAEIGICDKIFVRIGAWDNLVSGQSTFMVEMSESAYIVKNATKNSFVVLDEIGRGTATHDGLAIAASIIEYLTTVLKSKTIFATHYHEIDKIIKDQKIQYYTMEITETEEKIIFMHRLIPGKAKGSFGINVAKMAGLPKVVTDRSYTLLKEISKNNG